MYCHAWSKAHSENSREVTLHRIIIYMIYSKVNQVGGSLHNTTVWRQNNIAQLRLSLIIKEPEQEKSCIINIFS